MSACGGGTSGPTGPSGSQCSRGHVAPSRFKSRLVRAGRNPPPSVRRRGHSRWYPQTNLQTFKATIRSENAWLPVTTVSTGGNYPWEYAARTRFGLKGTRLATWMPRDVWKLRQCGRCSHRRRLHGRGLRPRHIHGSRQPDEAVRVRVDVDLEAPVEFIRTAYEAADWIAVFLKCYTTGRVAQRVGPVSLVTSTRFQAWLRRENDGLANVYVSVNAVRPGQLTRSRRAIRDIRHIFAEADHDGAQVVRTIDDRPDLPRPWSLLHSSPNRVHVFWRATGFAVARAESLQKRLARELRTDSAATPVSQMTRLPGSQYAEYRPPHLVTVEYRCIDRVYTPADFPTPVSRRGRGLEWRSAERRELPEAR